MAAAAAPGHRRRDLPLAELDHVVLVRLARLERPGEAAANRSSVLWLCGWKWTNQRRVLPGQLLALPRVSQQGGDGVDLDSGRLSILGNG